MKSIHFPEKGTKLPLLIHKIGATSAYGSRFLLDGIPFALQQVETLVHAGFSFNVFRRHLARNQLRQATNYS